MISSISQLNHPDQLHALAQDAERNGHRMVRRLCEDWISGSNRFDQPGEVVLIAEQHNQLVGVCALNRDPYSTDTNVGRIRRLYVTSDCRHMGVGRALVEAIFKHCPGDFETLHLRTYDHDADAFYRAIGFDHVANDQFCTHILKVRKGVRMN